MATHAQLESLIVSPNESLSVEYKSWLDLNDADAKATLAKAAIAIANHGGGQIVLGFREEENGTFTSMPRDDVAGYTQDQINGIIRRYASPVFHCECTSIAHPDTGVEHVIVSVPGGHASPIIALRGSPANVLINGRCYIRKPGPESAEPLTPEEWRTLFDRCLHNRREDMLDAIRGIVLGIEPPPAAVDNDTLREFIDRSRVRFEQRIADAQLPDDHAARFPLGSLEVALKIPDANEEMSIAVLRDRIRETGQVRHTGWSKFFLPNREEFAAAPIEGGIECWMGRPGVDRVFGDVAHSDFWRAEPGIFLYHRVGFDEDASDRVDPGTAFDITLPVWRVGEFVLFAGRLGGLLDEDPVVQVRVKYQGLSGRSLVALGGRRIAPVRATSHQDIFEYTLSFRASQAYDNLADIVRPMTEQLFELFDFTQLSPRLVAEESEALRESRM